MKWCITSESWTPETNSSRGLGGWEVGGRGVVPHTKKLAGVTFTSESKQRFRLLNKTSQPSRPGEVWNITVLGNTCSNMSDSSDILPRRLEVIWISMCGIVPFGVGLSEDCWSTETETRSAFIRHKKGRASYLWQEGLCWFLCADMQQILIDI